MSDISLYLDQDNELRFNVSIEGSKPGSPKYRLVFESKDCSYAFTGQQSTSGEVLFVVPAMKNALKEGSYRANLEVMVDDRYFVPLQFDADFEASIKVVAESISRPSPKKASVTASIITANTRSQTEPISESAIKPRPSTPQKSASAKESLGEIDGKQITADDLRNLIRLSNLR